MWNPIMICMKGVIFFLMFSVVLFQAQDYSDYRIRYDHYSENDDNAFKHIRPYIAKAKRYRNYGELAQAYKDAVSFSLDEKIVYADSMIWAASHAYNRNLLANAYLTKGTIYYFNYKKFKPALDEYLKAWKYSQHSTDRYLYYKNLYHIGVVKSYLGYHEEALDIFLQCEDYFSKPDVTPESSNIQYNRRKGYLNTLHQKGICLISLHRLPEAEELLKKAFEESGAESDYYLERSYFFKLKGILAFQKKMDRSASLLLTTSLAGFEKKDDFTNASLAYYYLGQSDLRQGKSMEAIMNFKKIDSIFRIHSFVLPEVRNAYEMLITYFHRAGNNREELYYTTQLLKADQILSTDFKYLSGKIHKEYDTQELLESKRRLEDSAPYFYLIIGGLFSASVGQALYLYRNKRSEKLLFQNYQVLLERAESAQQEIRESSVAIKRNHKISDKSLINLLQKLETFEKSRLFLEKGLTRNALSHALETNESYLSKVINKYKGNNFNGYLSQLRIQYITRMLQENSKYRNYSLEALAEECGFSDRTKFSKAFTEINGIAPTEFIHQFNRDFFKM